MLNAHRWTDADTFIINPAVPLDVFLPPRDLAYSPQTEPYILGNSDLNGFNSGVFFIKANMWSVNLLSRILLDPVLLQETPHVYNDQSSMSRLLLSERNGAALHFWQIPQHWLNEYDPAQDCNGSVQAHLVNHYKREKSYFGYVERAARIYAEANHDVTVLLRRPEVNQMRAEAIAYWQIAKPGIEGMKFLSEG